MRRIARTGPELLAAASDNDPTNIGTAAVVGAQTAYQLAWVALLIAPLLGVVQSIAAQVGAVGGNDLQSLASKRYGRKVARTLLASVVVVNVVTIAADLQAGAAGIGVLAGLDPRWVVAPLGLGLFGLLLVGKYDEVVAVLRYAMIGFLVFAVAAIMARPHWPSVLRASFVPSLSHREVLAGALAIVGTTLTSYVYVWETIERGVEEPLDPRAGGGGLSHLRYGAVVGAVFTAVVFWFMLVASGATLGRDHQTVSSAQDAARALRPLAGGAASDLFAAGLVVATVVALPVIMATTAYVVGAEFDWRRGLSVRVGHAAGFYGVMLASIALALVVALTRTSVVGMLVAASIVGGLGTPLGVAIMVGLARDPGVMGDRPISRPLAVAGWTVAALIGVLGLVYLVEAIRGQL
ncbi:MAG TPA: divalent metal cation transporter [Acidimicrobiales bacterium]|nr:divalent metal cation transporter [Acidimicrobiales bacterium]